MQHLPWSASEGLNGAPVVFRGVQVGQMTRVEALYDPKDTTIRIKVMVELVRGSIQVPEELPQTLRETGVDLMVQLIKLCLDYHVRFSHLPAPGTAGFRSRWR